MSTLAGSGILMRMMRALVFTTVWDGVLLCFGGDGFLTGLSRALDVVDADGDIKDTGESAAGVTARLRSGLVA